MCLDRRRLLRRRRLTGSSTDPAVRTTPSVRIVRLVPCSYIKLFPKMCERRFAAGGDGGSASLHARFFSPTRCIEAVSQRAKIRAEAYRRLCEGLLISAIVDGEWRGLPAERSPAPDFVACRPEDGLYLCPAGAVSLRWVGQAGKEELRCQACHSVGKYY